jgi:hypothetical protein
MAEAGRYVGREHRAAPKRPNFIPTTPKYYGYQWLDKDPDLEFIVGLIGESGLSPEDIEHETTALGFKVSRFTILNWIYGSVRRPQNYTLTIVAMALGYTKQWTDKGERRPPERRSFQVVEGGQ